MTAYGKDCIPAHVYNVKPGPQEARPGCHEDDCQVAPGTWQFKVALVPAEGGGMATLPPGSAPLRVTDHCCVAPGHADGCPR